MCLFYVRSRYAKCDGEDIAITEIGTSRGCLRGTPAQGQVQFSTIPAHDITCSACTNCRPERKLSLKSLAVEMTSGSFPDLSCRELKCDTGEPRKKCLLYSRGTPAPRYNKASGEITTTKVAVPFLTRPCPATPNERLISRRFNRTCLDMNIANAHTSFNPVEHQSGRPAPKMMALSGNLSQTRCADLSSNYFQKVVESPLRLAIVLPNEMCQLGSSVLRGVFFPNKKRTRKRLSS